MEGEGGRRGVRRERSVVHTRLSWKAGTAQLLILTKLISHSLSDYFIAIKHLPMVTMAKIMMTTALIMTMMTHDPRRKRDSNPGLPLLRMAP